MSFLDHFIERTDDPNSHTPKPDKKKKDSSTNSVPPINLMGNSNNITQTYVNPAYMPAGTNMTTGSISNEDIQSFAKHFDDLFKKANLPGPDYYEFQSMCQAMGNLPDETKFAAVFNGLKVQGLTKEGLLQTAGTYINVLEEDEKNFASAIDEKIISDIKNKRATAEQKKGEIKKKEEMIEALKGDITKETGEIADLEKDANEQEAKANIKSATYKTVCDARKNAILMDVEKIKTIIK